jgi:hypothetical protein
MNDKEGEKLLIDTLARIMALGERLVAAHERQADALADIADIAKAEAQSTT